MRIDLHVYHPSNFVPFTEDVEKDHRASQHHLLEVKRRRLINELIQFVWYISLPETKDALRLIKLEHGDRQVSHVMTCTGVEETTALTSNELCSSLTPHRVIPLPSLKGNSNHEQSGYYHGCGSPHTLATAELDHTIFTFHQPMMPTLSTSWKT